MKTRRELEDEIQNLSQEELDRITSNKRNLKSYFDRLLVTEGLTQSDVVFGDPEDPDSNTYKLHNVVRRLYTMAELGDLKAAELIFDRLFGRPTQAIEVPGDMRVLVIQGMSLNDL